MPWTGCSVCCGPGGWWAAWWSHARADGEEWCPPRRSGGDAPAYDRRQRDIDWAATVASSPRFAPPRLVRVPWRRELSLETWLVDETSKSYVGALTADSRAELLARMEAIASERFPTGMLTVPYETWLWTAQRE